MLEKAEDKRMPGTLNFLSPEEQLRVQRHLDMCDERKLADATTQVPNVLFISTGTQTVPVPAMKINNIVSCNCLDMILKNQEPMKELLGQLLKQSQQTSQPVTDLSSLDCIFVEPFK